MKRKEPLVMVLPVTDRCNGKCVMCGIWRRNSREDLPIVNVKNFFAQDGLANSVTHLNITGGEPFLYPDLIQIADYASHYLESLREITIGTSTLASENFAKIFISFRKHLNPEIMLHVAVSLDGVGKIHDKVRGVKGSYQKAIEAIKRFQEICVSENMGVNVNCTFSAVNFLTVKDVIKLNGDLNVNLSLTYACQNDLYLDNTQYSDGFYIEDENVKQLLACIQDWTKCNHISNTEKHYLKMTSSMLQGEERSSSCVLQKNGAFLDIDNTLYPCGTVSSLPYGSLNTHTFDQLFYSEKAKEIRKELLENHCPRCFCNSYYGLGEGTWLKVLRERLKK
jgi:MoaA/NifB/PqqE/SkfB family radical SAM enzyme